MKAEDNSVEYDKTWDGKPVSNEWPRGATIIVFRENQGKYDFLILHRHHQGPEYEGDWAWTPPSGARYPGEAISACAARELQEETGLVIPVQETDFGSKEWYVYLAEAAVSAVISLSPEHDRFAWVEGAEALIRCQPAIVQMPIRQAARFLDMI